MNSIASERITFSIMYAQDKQLASVLGGLFANKRKIKRPVYISSLWF